MEVRVPWPIRALVTLASVATPLCAMAAAVVAARALRIDRHVDWPLILGPPAVVISLLWLTLRRTTAVPRWIRASWVLVVLHACLLVGVAVLWCGAASVIKLDKLLPLSAQVPVEQGGAAVALILLVAALVSISRARRRGVPTWLTLAVRFLLAHLLAFGIVVPIVVAQQSSWYTTDVPPIAGVLVLTGAIALASTVTGHLKDYGEINRILAWLAIAGAVLASVLSAGMSNDSRWAYSNFGPLIVANVFLALVAINLLGAFHWLAVKPASQENAAATHLPGTVVVDDALAHASWVRCRGWMEGLRIESRPFHVRTTAGHLEVPERAKIVASLPVSTLYLAAGSSIPLLTDGDAVQASGYVDAPSAGPFRQSSMPIPGGSGIVVTTRAPVSPAHNAVLAIWRPCCLYLAAVTLIAAPAIVASLTYDEPVSLMLNGFARADVCGNPGQACCGELGYCHSGANCESDRTCAACGALGQECCARGYCGTNLHCDRAPSAKCVDGPEPEVAFSEGPERPGPAHSRDQLKPFEIQLGMSKVKSKVQSCYQRFREPGMVSVTLTIAPSGRVTSAWATGKFAGTDTGHCVERAVESARFRPFSGPAMDGIDYPFMLSR